MLFCYFPISTKEFFVLLSSGLYSFYLANIPDLLQHTDRYIIGEKGILNLFIVSIIFLHIQHYFSGKYMRS